MLVESFLEVSAGRSPDKIALVCGERRYRYDELEQWANRLARALQEAGVERGDRVLIQLDNSPEAVVSLFAALKAGALFVFTNPTIKPDKLGYLLRDSRARAWVTTRRRLRALRERRSALPHLHCVALVDGADASEEELPSIDLAELERQPGSPAPPGNRNIDIDLAALIYTSGSTGQPKGVMVSHRNVVAAATSITSYLENVPQDVILNVLPLSFDYGLYQLLMAFKVGATLILEKSFAYPQATLLKLQEERVTGFPLVPTISALLLQMNLRRFPLPSLRYFSNTGAALPTSHIARLRELFPHVRIYSMYGLTECKRVAYLPPDQIDIRPDSVGRAMPNVEVYLVDDDDRPVGPGAVGQLVVRGANVMAGYWELPEETARVLKPGPLPGERVLYTGDQFRMDEEGYLYFVGRTDDIIKSRGEKVSPKEVENVLCAADGVSEAAVVGVPDDLLGQAIKAFVVPRPGSVLTERELLRHCAGHLEDSMIPGSIEIRQRLACTASGKIDKNVLAPAAGGRMSRFTAAVLEIEVEPAIEEIVERMREVVARQLRRRGVVLGLSGGIDSSLCAALAVRALGSERVLGLFMPERDSSPDSLRLGRLLAESLGIRTERADLSRTLDALGCYRNRVEAIRRVIPEYADDWKSKIVLPKQSEGPRVNFFRVVARSPTGEMRSERLPVEAYLQLVAATNMKQRTRKMVEYFHAERLHYAVVGTPNRLEYDQGFFVKYGDGAADLKPIAHLYKTQVYRLAEALGLPREIREQVPTTDTYSLPQTQEEFYFTLPLHKMDLCLWAHNHGVPVDDVAEAAEMTVARVERTYEEIETKRRTTRFLHAAPILIEPVAEVALDG